MTRTLATLLLAAIALSCTEDSPCPPGQQFEKGYCLKQQSPADGAVAVSDAGSDTGQGDPDAAAAVDADLDAGSDAGSTATDFGASCTGQSACGGVASYCALQPGMPVGYCTAPGCDTMPQICPAGWTCFNVGVFKPGEPYICLRP
jgi:hypothetical protein